MSSAASRLFKVPSPSAAVRAREAYTGLRLRLRQGSAGLEQSGQSAALAAFDSAAFELFDGRPHALLPCARSLEAINLRGELLAGGMGAAEADQLVAEVVAKSAAATTELGGLGVRLPLFSNRPPPSSRE